MIQDQEVDVKFVRKLSSCFLHNHRKNWIDLDFAALHNILITNTFILSIENHVVEERFHESVTYSPTRIPGEINYDCEINLSNFPLCDNIIK